VQTCTSLSSLNLHGCKRISDKGLTALAKLPLKSLCLGMTRVRDEVRNAGAWPPGALV
jgi:hypothetical protein